MSMIKTLNFILKVHELSKARGFPSGKQYSLSQYKAMSDKFGSYSMA